MEEILPVVDINGVVIGEAPRSECHGGSMKLHPVVHLHLINERGDILLQKRSMNKHLLPGRWDTSVGGHVSAGEKISVALIRETLEELGLRDFDPIYHGSYIWESKREREYVHSFICYKYGELHVHNNEVDEVRFWSRAEIEASIGKDILTPNFEFEYQKSLSTLNA